MANKEIKKWLVITTNSEGAESVQIKTVECTREDALAYGEALAQQLFRDESQRQDDEVYKPAGEDNVWILQFSDFHMAVQIVDLEMILAQTEYIGLGR